MGSKTKGGDSAGGVAVTLDRRRPAVVLGDLTLVRPLAWAGVPVVAVSTDPGDVTSRSRYVRRLLVVPGYQEDEQAHTAALLARLGSQLADEAGGPVPLFYGSDDQLELLYRHRRELERSYVFVLNDEDLGWALLDKPRFAALCVARGVRAPRTVSVGDEADPAVALSSLRAPFVVKPKRKLDGEAVRTALFDGGAKARLFASAAELLGHPRFASVRDRVLVQEAIESPVDGLVSFHGFAARDGRVLASFCGRKVRTFPAFAGDSALIELVDDPAVEREGRDVAERLGLVGPFKIDLVRDARDAQLYTLEVNARFNLWGHLGAADGVNLLAIAYDYLVHGCEPDEVPVLVPRSRWQSCSRDLRMLRSEVARRPHAVVPWLTSLWRKPLVHEVFDWHDPLPFACWLAGLLRGKALGPAR